MYPVPIATSAPTRIDLAGGTIDIWPLYLFHDGASTLNAAISLRAHARVDPRTDGRIEVRSIDTDCRRGALVKQVQRPDVDRAAGQVDARRRGGGDRDGVHREIIATHTVESLASCLRTHFGVRSGSC